MLPQPWPVQSQHNIPTLCLRTSTRWAITSLNFDCFVHWAFHTHLNRCASQHKYHLIHNETKLHQQKWKIIIIVPSSDRPYIDRYGSSNWTRCCNINFFKLKYVKILTELGTIFISTHVVILEWACKIIWMKLGTEKGCFYVMSTNYTEISLLGCFTKGECFHEWCFWKFMWKGFD